MRSSSDLRTQYSIMSSSSSSIGLGVEFMTNLPSPSSDDDFDRKVPIDFLCFCCCSLKEEKPPPRRTTRLLLFVVLPDDTKEEHFRTLVVVGVVVGMNLIIIICNIYY